MKRLFAAIKIHPDKNFLVSYRKIKSDLKHEKIKWVEEENIHITLKFFGDTDEDRIDDICGVFDEIAFDHVPFGLVFKNIGFFGSLNNPRVIWVGMEKNKIIEQLASDVNESLKTVGFEPEDRNFSPHLTIGRIKFIKDKKYFQRTINKYSEDFYHKEQVNRLYLLESFLRPQGPVYEIIETFELGK